MAITEWQAADGRACGDDPYLPQALAPRPVACRPARLRLTTQPAQDPRARMRAVSGAMPPGFRLRRALPHHRAQGWDTCPMMHIFRTCKNLLSELENLPHAPTGNPEDADSKARTTRWTPPVRGGGVVLHPPGPA